MCIQIAPWLFAVIFFLIGCESPTSPYDPCSDRSDHKRRGPTECTEQEEIDGIAKRQRPVKPNYRRVRPISPNKGDF